MWCAQGIGQAKGVGNHNALGKELHGTRIGRDTLQIAAVQEAEDKGEAALILSGGAQGWLVKGQSKALDVQSLDQRVQCMVDG